MMIPRNPNEMTGEERVAELASILATGIARLHLKQNPIFFVVRKVRGEETFSLEHGDFADRYSKDEQAAIVYRASIRTADLTLDQCIAAYKSGVRMKPEPQPVVAASVTRNNVKARSHANGQENRS